MYLRGSKWSMNRRRQKRPNWFLISLLVLLIAGFTYMDRFIIPTYQSPFVATPTNTPPPEQYITQAQEFFNQGKLSQAIEAYQQALALKPSDPSIYVALAQVQVFAGDYKDAQTNAEDALLLNANLSEANAVRAWALDWQGDYLNAEAAVKRALELDPNNADAHAYYAEILADDYITGGGTTTDGINTAIDESKTALALAPNSLVAHRARGYILEVTGNYEEAIREYQAADAINDNIEDLHLSLGRNYRALGSYDQAVEEFTKANALNPSDPTADELISRTYATVGEYAKAVQYAESAVKAGPSDANLIGNLGVMYYHNVDWPDAVKELSLVVNGGTTDAGQKITPIQLTPDTHITEYYFTYALVLARLNRCGEALQIAQLIQSRVPSDDTAMTNAAAAIQICQKNLASPPAPTATISVTETSTPAPATSTAFPAVPTSTP
ncbi:MAG TPA: tetratricopeptide repeat protein [Anaerolineales bacterium]|nr:tetratricopeptide repeat protein [Anaerolineales bacterium]